MFSVSDKATQVFFTLEMYNFLYFNFLANFLILLAQMQGDLAAAST